MKNRLRGESETVSSVLDTLCLRCLWEHHEEMVSGAGKDSIAVCLGLVSI